MNTCRPCGIRGIVTEATWIMEPKEVENWYLCDHHARLIADAFVLTGRSLQQLENAGDVRQRQREVVNDTGP